MQKFIPMVLDFLMEPSKGYLIKTENEFVKAITEAKRSKELSIIYP